MKKNVLDWPTFVLTFGFLVVICSTIFLYPNQTEVWLDQAHTLLMDKIGILYLWVGFLSVLFLCWIAFSRYGRIKLGPKHEKPAFSTFSWISMLFCAGIGGGVIYWGTIEWAYYYATPPFGLDAGTAEAIEWSATYGMFHSGPTAWAIYCLPAIPMAYLYHVKGKKILKISEACQPILKHHTNGFLGKAIDLMFMFGLLGASGTTLGLSIPMISAGIHRVLGVPHTYLLDIVILLICTIIFSISVYSGLSKGIKRLSDINVYLAIFLLAFVFILGPTVFILKMTTNSIGLIADHFIRLNTWIDPIMNTGFPEKWTLFYWAWWIVFAPFIGLFIAKISRGRTLKQMILGAVGFGSLGCWLFYSILGNYGLYLQLNDLLQVSTILEVANGPEAIVSIIHSLPFGDFIVLLFSVLSIIFIATTYDTSSYMLAAVTQNQVDDDPVRWNRLFWAFGLALPPTALMFIGGLKALQTVTIIAALPSVFILVLLAFSFLRIIDQDRL
ncbi:BCCT family transporter [Salinibacillus xinjiangensis]|uniref:BCCT family transporter n=1 Tax=Salinibacillus xinjiangensis TaxID=1229268 RepID=UPI001891C7B6|nr:BCCT family transporter [Salinibacillus xinjiangensis]